MLVSLSLIIVDIAQGCCSWSCRLSLSSSECVTDRYLVVIPVIVVRVCRCRWSPITVTGHLVWMLPEGAAVPMLPVAIIVITNL